MMKNQRCKGSRDLSPAEMAAFRFIEGTFRDCCLKWGYREVRTPTLEYLHLFTSTGTLTPSRLGKVYSFLDWDGWSGERVVLRPDGTIPIARLYIDSMAGEKLARLFYVTNIFVFEETGKESREKWQLGAELIGVSSPTADVELVMLALEVLKRLGLKGIELRLSHAGLIRALLKELGLSPEEQAKIFDRILDGDAEALARVKRERPEVGKILSLLDLKGKPSRLQFTSDLPELKPAIDDFINIARLLESLGGDYQIDIASGRGFEYYTGIIFQIFQDGDKIGGGGRYDALIPLMGGKDTPASGFALYLDHLMKLVKPEALAKGKAPRILVRAEAEAVKDGFSTASRLREAGYRAEMELGGQKEADFNWRLEVRNKPPLFILTDQAKRQKFEAKTADEVLAIIRKVDADKGSAA
jgi:histidyl-tRNA synthetase